MFAHRTDAGDQLASGLKGRLSDDAVVLGLPRGGVVVAAAIARSLGLDLDVYVVRKLRAPDNPEFAIGALAEDGPPLIEDDIVRRLRIPGEYVAREIEAERAEIRRQVETYRRARPLPPLSNREVAVVDDGIATGSTVNAALIGLRLHHPSRLLVATPVSSPSGIELLSRLSDEVIALEAPDDFWAVGQFYASFDQVTDGEVVEALARNNGQAKDRLGEPSTGPPAR